MLSLSGHAIAYRWRSLPRVHRHRPSKPQGSSKRVLPWQVTMDQLICARIWFNRVTHVARIWINRVRLPILHGVSWTGEMDFSVSAFAPENLVSRDGFGSSPVPLIPAWEDRCECHRMAKVTGPDCTVMCNLINTHTHNH